MLINAFRNIDVIFFVKEAKKKYKISIEKHNFYTLKKVKYNIFQRNIFILIS